LGSKTYWTQALAQMERMMQTSVTLTVLDASATKGTIKFSATADSYAAVARQLASFSAATGINDVTLGTVKSSPAGVEFQGELTIDPKLLILTP